MRLNWFPCVACAGLIAAAGIKVLYYNEIKSLERWSDPKYGFPEAKAILEAHGVKLVPVVPRG